MNPDTASEFNVAITAARVWRDADEAITQHLDIDDQADLRDALVVLGLLRSMHRLRMNAIHDPCDVCRECSIRRQCDIPWAPPSAAACLAYTPWPDA